MTPPPSLPPNLAGRDYSKARAAWAHRVLRAFPDMTAKELREALTEKFGAAIDGRKLAAIRHRVTRTRRHTEAKPPERKVKTLPLAPKPAEHPDDRATRERAQERARESIVEFFRSHHVAFKALVALHDDQEATRILKSLREEFWGNL